MEAFFYASIGACGLLLLLRVIIFVIRAYRDERRRGPARSTGSFVPARKAENESDAVLQPFQSILPRGDDDDKPKQPDGHARPGRAALDFYRGLVSAVFYGHGLTGRMIIAFSAIIASFGLLTIATVYFTLTASLERHALDRARVTAVNIRDTVPAFLFKKDISGLRAFLRNYAGQGGVAYVLVENSGAKVLAHSFAVLPEEVRRESLGERLTADKPRELQLGERAVHEMAVAASDGRVGAVRLGIWRDEVNEEISRAVTPLIQLILLVVGVGVLLAIFLAWKINRPILKLVKTARSISTGDLNAPSLDVEDPTEFGELSRALERLRSSVNAALNRLNAER
jgi:HAMP domain-containing protein